MKWPSAAQLMGRWQQQLGTVKAALLQARYAFSRVEADAQVQCVLARSKG